MNSPDTSPWPEVAQVFVGAVCGVLTAALAVLVWLWVEDRSTPPVVEVVVTEDFSPGNQMEV